MDTSLIPLFFLCFVVAGLLSFNSTSVTRWYVNVPIPEVAAIRERWVVAAFVFSAVRGV